MYFLWLENIHIKTNQSYLLHKSMIIFSYLIFVILRLPQRGASWKRKNMSTAISPLEWAKKVLFGN